MEPAPPREQGAPPTVEECPRCRAPYERYQEYCLECGARLPAAPYSYPTATGAYLWSRESQAWLWAALVALLVLALGLTAVVAVASTRGDGEGERSARGGRTAATTPPPILQGPATVTLPQIATVTRPAETAATAPDRAATARTGTIDTSTRRVVAGTALAGWPGRKDGFTIVLASVPTSRGRSEAEATARRALDAGLTQVGVLNSSDYLSLNPGYYVTFTGIYDTLGAARNDLESAHILGFPRAYVREILP